MRLWNRLKCLFTGHDLAGYLPSNQRLLKRIPEKSEFLLTDDKGNKWKPTEYFPDGSVKYKCVLIKSELNAWIDNKMPDLGPNSHHARSCLERGFLKAIDVLKKECPANGCAENANLILKAFAGIK